MRVVLPAPFGPISAWISPAQRSRLTLSVAFSAPKLFRRFRMARMVSAMASFPRQQADKPPARKQDDAKQDKAEEELPTLGEAAENGFEQHEKHGAGNRSEQPARAAQNDEHNEFARHLPGEHRGADEAIEIGKQRAGESGHHGGEHES